MQLTAIHRKNIVKGYCLVFYLLMLYKIWNGFLLVQLKPSIFNTRFDVFTWVLMNTGIHQWLLNNEMGWILFDVAFYALPLGYWVVHQRSVRFASWIAIIMLPVNWIYISCYTLYPANSIESFIPWLLFPFLLMTTSLQSFYYVLNGLRYFFLFFFVSAGIWKIVQGAVINSEQMTGVLLFQHKELLTGSVNWSAQFIDWLLHHPLVGYCLYLFATFMELIFIVGYFTKKYDRYLIGAFLLFLIADVVVMRIPYWEVTPFLLTLIYSKLKLNDGLIK